MKKSTFITLLVLMSLGTVGFTPDIGSDYAEYRRLPKEKRITRLQKAGEDLFLRRRYEDAIKVFETILKLRENDLTAKMWISKSQYEIKREQDEANKTALYKKYNGHLLPEDQIYINWKFGPEIGHFEVRYSEPKPRPVYKKKNRPWATDRQIESAIAKAKSGSASETFELAMLYWSRKDLTNALKNYYKACQEDPELLGEDDEDLISSVLFGLESKIASGKAVAADYYEAGRIDLLQSNAADGIKYALKAAKLDGKAYGSLVNKLIEEYLESLPQNNLIENPEVNAFRQAYVHDKGEDFLYLYVNATPRNKGQIFFIDLNVPLDMIVSSVPNGNDTIQCFATQGLDDAARIWFLLPEKAQNDFSSYEAKCVLKLDRTKSDLLELSNYAMRDLFDNWSFIIGNEVNFASLSDGVNEFDEEGLRVSGHHLHLYGGRGPYIKLSEFTEDIPSQMNIKDMYALMIPREYELEEEPAAQTAAPVAQMPPSAAANSTAAENESAQAAAAAKKDGRNRPNVVYDIYNNNENAAAKDNKKAKATFDNSPVLPSGDINDMDIGL